MINQMFTCDINCASLSSDFLRCTIAGTNDVVLRVSEAGRLAAVVLDLDKIQELIDCLEKAKKELSQ